ncbi:MAG: TolC family protein [Ferruginibacter sp.]|nr:TolC family protein [Ferruginibacter sp.]
MKKTLLQIIVFIFTSVYGCAQNNNQLSFYVENALRNSPLLSEYESQLQSSRYDSLLIRAAYKTQVTGTSFNSYAPVIKGIGYDEAITNGANVAALVGVNKQLPNRKVLNAQFRNIQLQNELAGNSSAISQQDLKKTIIAQYITAYGDLQQLDFNRQVNNLLSKEESLLKKLTQKNVYREVDYLAFLVTLQQQSLVIKQLTMQYQEDYATLNYLSGVTDTTFILLQDPQLSLHQLPSIEQSVFFKKYELDSLKLKNDKAVVEATYLPKINVFADGGYNSSLAYQYHKNFGTSFGVSASIPIYDGRQKQMQYSKLSVAEKTRSRYRDFFLRQYRQQVAQLTQQLASTDELITAITDQVRYSKALMEANGKLLQAGELRVADYIVAINNYLTVQNQLSQNTINRLQIINQLNYWNR